MHNTTGRTKLPGKGILSGCEFIYINKKYYFFCHASFLLLSMSYFLFLYIHLCTYLISSYK